MKTAARRFLGLPIVGLLTCIRLTAAEPPDAGIKRFENSIVRLPAGAQLSPHALNSDARQRKLELHFALSTNNFDELQARVAQGDVVSSSEMKTKYSGSQADFRRLVTWLKSQHFQITQASDDYTSVYARASVAQIEKSLGTKMVPVTYRGITTPSATTAPALPRDIGEHVISIGGLQPFVQAVKHTVPRDEHRRRRARNSPPIPRPNTSTQPSYKVVDVLRAYDADGLGVTGTGQTIAILIDTFPAEADLQTFWEKNGLAVTAEQVQLINVRGQGTPLPPREGEETLDTEWASGIAPGATIRVYASGSLEYAYLDRALDKIFADAQTNTGLRQLSISLGLREDLVSAGEIQVEHAIFVKLAALGVTVFVSSGDAGSNPDETGHARSVDTQVEYESSDAFTLSIGGTSLTIDRTTGKVVSETGWEDSGGGLSNVFLRPSWQRPFASLATRNRLIPDVSCVADPEPGAFVWLNGHEWPVGGTSWSAPVWAGFSALIAEARLKRGKSRLGFLAPALYRLPANAGLRDITDGSNGAYRAGAGWDPVTGLGVPSLRTLLNALP